MAKSWLALKLAEFKDDREFIKISISLIDGEIRALKESREKLLQKLHSLEDEK